MTVLRSGHATQVKSVVGSPPSIGAGQSGTLGEAAARMHGTHQGQLISPVHIKIPGRARLRVAGLFRSPALQALLERDLAAFPGIHAVAASALTGNLLVTFDDSIVPLDRIMARVTGFLRGDILPPTPGIPGPGTHNAPHWHARSVADTATELRTSATDGLSTAVAANRLTQEGTNLLEQPLARSGLKILLEQFHSLPVGLLAVAAILSVATGGALEAMAILAVVTANGFIGYAVESQSERTISSLSTAADRTAWVVRDGIQTEVGLESVVPGDVLSLRHGILVPADARIVSARDLTVSEAMLTGESLPVTKSAEALSGQVVPLADRVNMVYRGTVVTGGSGTAIVVATGPNTEVGRIQRMLSSTAAPETPMQRQLGEIGQQLVWLSLGVCAVVFGVGVLRGFGALQMFRSAVSLAVAAVPEGLPAIATTTLALGTREMRRHDVIVRRLDAVETLASVRVICFDKTGTLTLNHMSVAEVAIGRGEPSTPVDAAGQLLQEGGEVTASPADNAFARLLQIGLLCSETQIEEEPDGRLNLSGSATENALVQLALDLKVDAAAVRRDCPRLSIRYRSEAYRFMVTTHQQASEQEVLVAVKGSPADVLARCTWWQEGSHRRMLTAEDRAAIERANAAMANAALRVLGFAFKCIGRDDTSDEAALASGLTWMGLAGMADPVRPGIRELMGTLQGAGIHTVIMTGDQVPTARAVARQLGFNGTSDIEVLDAAEFYGMTPERLAAAAQRVHVLARVSPAQKLQVVQALQRSGVVVAMIGDGINDSPALKAADVGIAMGRSGTDAAREVADVVLQTDDLTALARAVEHGRTIYTNVRKSIRYLLGSNISEVSVVLAATAAGLAEPLSVPQLLWINLVSDVFPALGLALEPPVADVMHQPPRPADEGILRGRDLVGLAVEGGVITAGGLLACGWGVLRYGASAEARTMTFGTLVTAQLLYALTCRSSGVGDVAAVGQLPPNRALTGALATSFALQGLGLLVPGLRRFLGIAPLGLLDIGVMLGAGTLPYFVNGALKASHSGPWARQRQAEGFTAGVPRLRGQDLRVPTIGR